MNSIHSTSNLINVSSTSPCPICGHSDWCTYSEDGARIICRRVETGSVRVGTDASGAQYYVHLTEIGKNQYQSRIERERIATETIPQASPEFTNEFYKNLLKMLSLTPAHRGSLRARGLTDEEIDRLGYKSWPDEPPWKFARRMRDQYGLESCLSIPGFFMAENKLGTKRYLTLNYRPGFIIPSIDRNGQIQAIVTRADKADGGAKYVLLSSRKRGGFTPSMDCHIPGIGGNPQVIRITEGILKADIATLRGGILTIGLYGLTWKRALPTLQQLSPEKIFIAFDADSNRNLHVAQSIQKLIESLRQSQPAASVCLEVWPESWGKGIDDVLVAGYRPSVLENPTHIDREVERMIESARTDSEKTDAQTSEPDAVIDDLNSKHAVLPVGSNVLILWERNNEETKRIETDFIRKNDFLTLYENRFVEVRDENGNAKQKPAAKLWLTSPERRQYEQIVFNPGKTGNGDKYYNLWRGFSVDPAAGDWSLFKKHIEENICAGDPEIFQYILAWMADAVQNLTDRPGVAVVLRGKQGTGKGIFCRLFGELFGQHFIHISQSKHLTGSFNSHLKDCLILFADEAFWAGDKSGEGSLKALITEPEFLIEMKGHDAIRMRNRVRLLIASNSEWVIPAGLEERRFCVIDVSDGHMQDHAYFESITNQMNAGGRAAMLYDLLQYDLSAVNLRKIPQTAALFDQKIQSLSAIEQFWYVILQQGKIYEIDSEWREDIEKDKLYELYQKISGQAGIQHKGFQTKFGIHLRKICPQIHVIQKTVTVYDETNSRTGSAIKRFWKLPDLYQCRDDFARIMNAKIEWDSVLDNEEESKDEFYAF